MKRSHVDAIKLQTAIDKINLNDLGSKQHENAFQRTNVVGVGIDASLQVCRGNVGQCFDSH